MTLWYCPRCRKVFYEEVTLEQVFYICGACQPKVKPNEDILLRRVKL